jgi:hypothetical protein
LLIESAGGTIAAEASLLMCASKGNVTQLGIQGLSTEPLKRILIIYILALFHSFHYSSS